MLFFRACFLFCQSWDIPWKNKTGYFLPAAWNENSILKDCFLQEHSIYICAALKLMTNRYLLLPLLLLTIASCGRYSKVSKDPTKETKKENPRIYGEVDGPARQSKQTYAAAPDAAEKSARIRQIMFGNKKSAAQIAAEEASVPAPAAAAPKDSASEKK